MNIVNPFLDGMQRHLIKLLNKARQQGEFSSSNTEAVAIAYLTLIDGVLVELLYGGKQRYRIGVEAAWDIFWRGAEKGEYESVLVVLLCAGILEVVWVAGLKYSNTLLEWGATGLVLWLVLLL